MSPEMLARSFGEKFDINFDQLWWVVGSGFCGEFIYFVYTLFSPTWPRFDPA